MQSPLLLLPLHEIDDMAYSEQLDKACDGFLRDSQFFAVDMPWAKTDKSGAVESANQADLAYAEFAQHFMTVNTPLMIRVRICNLALYNALDLRPKNMAMITPGAFASKAMLDH